MSGDVPEDTDRWQFWIDVGGTFSDCVARSPDGRVEIAKVLSSSVVKGIVGSESTERMIVDSARLGENSDVYRGFSLRILSSEGALIGESRVLSSSGVNASFELESPIEGMESARIYELVSPEEAPVLAIRSVLGLRLDEPVPPGDLRLGTTRGTNALLERKGARTAFITTRGFADILRIGYQQRPDLFAMAVKKAPALYEETVEIDERIAADGSVIEGIEIGSTRARLEKIAAAGIESVAVCLLNAYRNSSHEEAVGRIAEEMGFRDVVLSSRVAPGIRMVPRGDTTVVDAYLHPVLRKYIASISASLPGMHLRLLTSAGALAAPRSFRGKDSILSGPAGGVVGVSKVAERHNIERAIGFDMGGTSTDVSRYGGDFEIEFETEKAGVRIMAPHLAIETVAAGGGSICDFDGERLIVGPESAGASPGPACYGAGGPLTITDVNYFLGRVPDDRFPFPLDRSSVMARLGEIARRLEIAGYSRSFEDIALGFIEIASSTMASAIRRISVARGHDVRDYTLVVFGGAGAMHACPVAEELGMSQILVPHLAGVLSAFGAGQADTTKYVESTVLDRLSKFSIDDLNALFSDLEGRARKQVLDDGLPSDARPGDEIDGRNKIDETRRQLDLRYEGQDDALTIDCDGEDPAGLFEAEHLRLYGYLHTERALELVSARVICTSKSNAIELFGGNEEFEAASMAASETKEIRARFRDGEMRVPVMDVDHLRRGQTIEGPAILLSQIHTVVVEPGWRADKVDGGDLRIVALHSDAASPNSRQSARLDPARLEIFHRRFASIAEEMGVTLRRSALSINVKDRLDFSCAVFDASGGIVANAPHIPVHLGALGDCVKHVMAALPDLGPGDVVLTNDPFGGGSHLPDITVITPVFSECGDELLFYLANRAHHAEIGGIRPGSMPPDSRNLEEEGVLIRNFRVVERGEPRLEALREMLESAKYPSRSPDVNLADIEAQIAANRRGALLLTELTGAQGRRTTLLYMRYIQEAAGRLMEKRLRDLGSVDARFEDALDDGTPIAVHLRIDGGRARVDFSGTGPVLESNLNATPAIVSSAVLYTFRLLLEGDIPLNSGVLEPIEIVLPECCLNPPVFPRPDLCAAVSGGNVETSQRIVDVLLGALGVAAASQGTMNNLLFGDESFGYYETIAGGSGAVPGHAGADAVHTHMTNTRITDPEILELRYPVRLLQFAIRRDSGGRGKWPGGDGLIREFEFLAPLEISIVSQRRTRGPYGLGGGGRGAPGRNEILRAGGKWETLTSVISLSSETGDRLKISTPGGGGCGEC